jgi:hypothetical protein
MVYLKGRGGPSKVYRGSRRRIRRLTMRQNWPPDSWLLTVIAALMLVVLIWVSQNLPADHPPDGGMSLGASNGR